MNERKTTLAIRHSSYCTLEPFFPNTILIIPNVKGAAMEINISLPYLINSEGITLIPGDLSLITLYRAIFITPQMCVSVCLTSLSPLTFNN
jgi:hypothetical protein